nr:methyltransferase domain-containing protein [uncultured Cohaesibacter sp.]
MTDIPRLFDIDLLAHRRKRALETYGTKGDFLLRDVAADMLDRLSMVMRPFPKIAELGGHTGLLAKTLASRPGTEQIIRLEQHPCFFQGNDIGILFDPEKIPLKPQSFNLVVSPLFLQWVNDLPGTLIQICQSLAPDGLLLATLLGAESLRELREAFLVADSEISGGVSPRVSPLPDLNSMGTLLQRAGFALPVVDHDILTVRYPSALALLQDLRSMGATNILVDRSKKTMRRETLKRVLEVYQERFSDPDGKVRATFEILSLSGWAPAPNQQKPLRPGSAKVSLASVLGDKSAR